MLKVLAVVAVALIIAVVGVTGWQQVDAGHRGVKTTWGKVDMSQSYDEGGYWVMPVAERITQLSIQTVKYDISVESASKDLQVVNSNVAVNHKLQANDVNKVFKEIGPDYQTVLINPIVSETIKQVTAKYNAEDLIQERPKVKAEIEETIKNRLSPYSILVEQVSVTDFDFSPEFNSAIERKQVAEQDALTAKNKVAQVEAEALQKKAFAEGEKFSKIELANGEAEALRIKGDAEAYRNRVVKESLDGDILTLEQIKQWDGKFPNMYVGGNGESPAILLNIPSPQTNTP